MNRDFFINFNTIFYFSNKNSSNNLSYSFFVIVILIFLASDFLIWSSNDYDYFLDSLALVYGDIGNTNKANISHDKDTKKEDSFKSSNKEISDYTLLIYMVGSTLEDQSYEATKDINEMLKADTHNANTNILLQTGGSNGKRDDKRFIDFSTVQRHSIYGGSLNTLKDLGVINLGDSNTLKDFLKWGISEYPAKKYGLIMWDHGASLDGFGRDVNFKELDPNGDRLFLEEIEHAIYDITDSSKIKFEFIGFDSCLMASIEVASFLTKNYPIANYLIASEEIEPNWGWNYSVLINSITNEPEITGDLLGMKIIDSYVIDSESMSIKEKYSAYRDITLSVIDLNKIQVLQERLNELANAIRMELGMDEYSLLKLLRAIDLSEQYGQNAKKSFGIIDIYDFVTNLENNFPSIKEKTNSVKDMVDKIILGNHSGQSNRHANGISIYLPLFSDEFSTFKYYNDNNMSVPTYHPYWMTLVGFINMMVSNDVFNPLITSERQGEHINVQTTDSDIGSIIMEKILNSNTGEPIRRYIQSLDPSILDEKRFFQVNQKKLLVLCNEINVCLPASMKMDVSKDEKMLFIPVTIVSESGSKKITTLNYELRDKDFIFLGGVDNTKSGPISKEKISLKKGDRIYTEAMKFHLSTENPLRSILDRLDLYEISVYDENEYNKYLEVFDPEKVKPAYKDVNSSSTRILICDFNDNCEMTRFYDFNSSNLYDKVNSYILQPKTMFSDSQLYYQYVNEPYDFQLQFPSEWVLIDLNISRSLQNTSSSLAFYFSDFTDPLVTQLIPKKEILNLDPNSFLNTRLDLQVQDSKYFDDPKRIFKYLANASEFHFGNTNVNFEYEIIDSNSTKINGFPAFEFIFEGNTDSEKNILGIKEKRLSYNIMIIMNQRQYTLGYDNYESEFYEYLPLVKKIINTLKPNQFNNSNLENFLDYKIISYKEIIKNITSLLE